MFIKNEKNALKFLRENFAILYAGWYGLRQVTWGGLLCCAL